MVEREKRQQWGLFFLLRLVVGAVLFVFPKCVVGLVFFFPPFHPLFDVSTRFPTFRGVCVAICD